MVKPEKNNSMSIWLYSLIPGLGHLILGYKRTGVHLIILTLSMAAILIWRWEIFLELLFSNDIERWIGSAFIIIMLFGCYAFSFWDVVRLTNKNQAELIAKSPFKLAMRRFNTNKLALFALYIIIFFFLTAFLSPIIAPHSPVLIDDVINTRYIEPSLSHPFGTDELGRDLFTRALYGARVSLSVGLLAVIIAITIGTIYGAIAGFFGGLIDNILMRVLDVIMAFPIFFLLLMLVAIFEVNILVMVLIMGFTSWMGTARYIRGEILSLKEREFIEAARAIGLSNSLIILRHLIPNALSPVLVSSALMVGSMIGAEAGLSFLGIGIRPPTPTWGNMINSGADSLLFAWWIAFFPGALLAITILCFNLIADGLRDALDPKTLMRKYI